DSGNAERLKEENEQLTNLLNETEAALATAKRDLDRKNVEIAELIRSSEDSATSSEQLEMFERKLNDAEKVLKQEMATKVELLREELKKAEDRNDLVLERHQKAEAAALEAAKGQKQLLDELEKKLEAADGKRTETESKLSALEDKLKSSNDELDEKKEHIKKLEQELVGLQNEKKKLESRASVADELNTLMSSLSAVRAENGQYQEEIRALHEQVREVKEELERSMEECDEWKGRFETAEREKEVMEKRINAENEK
ncbi:hypothetical protein TELCIR_20131, partial [Teladorsagia circumcincta]